MLFVGFTFLNSKSYFVFPVWQKELVILCNPVYINVSSGNRKYVPKKQCSR